MTKELEKKQENAVVNFENFDSGNSGVDTNDLLVPKLLVMQGLSKMVVEDKAQMGDFVDSFTCEILGSAREKATKPVKIIPLRLFKTWIEFTKDGKTTKFRDTFPYSESNKGLEKEVVVDGKTVIRYLLINAFVLLADKLDYFPLHISFKSTSFKAGKKLNTYFMQQQMLKLPPFYNVLELTAKKETNDKGTYYILDFDLAKKTKATQEAMTTAFKWYQTLEKASVRLDNSDLREESTLNDEEVEDVKDERF